jgi:hypothetical protein
MVSFCSMDETCHATSSKWKHAALRSDGVKGGGMRGKIRVVNSGESLHGPASGRVRNGISYCESRTEAVQEVGDGHSTEDPKDNITIGEERAISLECLCLKEVSA